MDKVKIAICDDDTLALSAIKGIVSQIFYEADCITDIDAFSRPPEFMNAVKAKQYQLILLDIDMKGSDGIDLAARIRASNNPAEILFVSNCENRVFDSFQINPLGFVRKSNFFDDMSKYVKKYIKQLNRTPKTLPVQCGTTIKNLPFDDIIYIEGALSKQHVFVSAKKSYYTISSSMKNLENFLNPFGFIRIHNGYLVNAKYISEINAKDVTLKNGTILPVSRGKLQETRESFLKIMRSEGNISF